MHLDTLIRKRGSRLQVLHLAQVLMGESPNKGAS
jgi:hypothetical protein